ncbi:MAG TPA: UDP-3-O-[3-hydroxymyristoyl] N-acetylglucosamine deacetylase [Alphaproteobacteria bacterium]|nr:UDP-3-O-[3-hydroxymyristoyl] N-acetylglucosamine deacetylase [Alphaproteobacteria bacterium]
MPKNIKQRTIKKQVSASGIGLHSSNIVELTLKPASVDTGIVFKRTDIENSELIKAKPESVTDTRLSTQIGTNPAQRIGTVEHLMSALYGCGIDNVIVELSGPEIPIFDGSSASFMLLIDNAGIKEQDADKKFIKIMDHVRVEDDGKFAEFTPNDIFSLDLEIDFNHPIIPKQAKRFDITSNFYKKEIARARTFCFQKDVEYMQSIGLALGGGLDNAIVIGDFAVLNKDGLRYKDEFIRHKILDCIGDLYMVGYPILGHFNAELTGHGLNNKLLREIFSDDNNWKFITLPEDSSSIPFI